MGPLGGMGAMGAAAGWFRPRGGFRGRGRGGFYQMQMAMPFMYGAPRFGPPVFRGGRGLRLHTLSTYYILNTYSYNHNPRQSVHVFWLSAIN